MNYLNTLLFGVYPYMALAVFVVATIIRYDREQYTWKSGSSQLLESKQLKRGSIAFHVGILMILMGHFVGLLTPAWVWHALGISPGLKQVIAITLGGFFGLVCLFGLITLISRRLNNPRVRSASTHMDIVILFLLLAQLLLGLFSIFISVNHLDGSEMLLLMAWAQNIVTLDLQNAVAAISEVHWIFKMHIFLGISLFVVFPFSRLVHVLSVPLQYFGRNYQVVRKKS